MNKKELSIEEKAKRYDNIIEKANKMHHENCEACQMCIEELIPELKESEDERIRKDIISLVKETKFTERYYDLSKMLAWLEKQGEQKPTDNEMIEILRAEYEKGRADAIEEMQNHTWSEEDEKMCQDTIDWFEKKVFPYALEHENPARANIKWLKSLKDRVQPRQEWSEEDELHIRELEGLVKQVWAKAEHENDKDTIHKMSDLSFFLKTLKPQPRQEWSEEDEYHKRQILRIFKDKGCSQTLQDKTEKWIEERLKSLRPQPHWKPSDEQMRQLHKYCPDNMPLTELYEQLKKLKEE